MIAAITRTLLRTVRLSFVAMGALVAPPRVAAEGPKRKAVSFGPLQTRAESLLFPLYKCLSLKGYDTSSRLEPRQFFIYFLPDEEGSMCINILILLILYLSGSRQMQRWDSLIRPTYILVRVKNNHIPGIYWSMYFTIIAASRRKRSRAARPGPSVRPPTPPPPLPFSTTL